MARPAPLAPDAHVLVHVGLDLVGDALIKLPMLRALRAAVPEGRITWLAGKGPSVFAGPLRTSLIDEVLDDAGIGRRAVELLGPRPLAGRRFDLVLDTQRRVLPALIARRIAAGRFVSGAAGFAFSQAKPPKGWRRPRRLAEELLALVEIATGRPAAQAGTLFPLTPEVEAAAAAALPPSGRARIGLVPGAGGAHKCWPEAAWLALAGRLAKRGLAPVVILGPAEADRAAVWRAEGPPETLLPLQSAAAQAVGGGVPLTIALGRLLDAAAAADSGGGHMLAAAGCPLVSLFGPTDPGKFAPWTARAVVLRAQAWGGPEMARIPIDAVEAALLELAGLTTTSS